MLKKLQDYLNNGEHTTLTKAFLTFFIIFIGAILILLYKFGIHLIINMNISPMMACLLITLLACFMITVIAVPLYLINKDKAMLIVMAAFLILFIILAFIAFFIFFILGITYQ